MISSPPAPFTRLAQFAAACARRPPAARLLLSRTVAAPPALSAARRKATASLASSRSRRSANMVDYVSSHCRFLSAPAERLSLPSDVRQEQIAKGKWLALSFVHFTDQGGTARVWEATERTSRKGDTDAVLILATLHRKDHKPEIVLVRQYRPPTGKICLEFPAGLIDANETAEAAALRELKEETGFVGTVISSSPIVFADPGMSTANFKLVHLKIDGDDPVNVNPVSQLEENEYIEMIVAPIEKLLEVCSDHSEKGYGVDGRVISFAHGLQLLRI